MFTDAELLQIKNNIQDARAWMTFKRDALLENKIDIISRYGWKDLQTRQWTPMLNPGMKTRWDYPDADYTNDQMEKWIPRLVQKRSECLQREGIDPRTANDPGKILVSIYTDSIYCTAAESCGDLFVDCSERPTWDSWIGWLKSTDIPRFLGSELYKRPCPVLFAWVPKEEWEFMEVSMDATPYGNLRWISNVDMLWAAGLKKCDET